MPDERPPREPTWRRYLRFWRSDVAADVDDELRFHFEERVDDLIARGMDRDAAWHEARRRFGNVEDVKRTCNTLASEQERSMRRQAWLGAVTQDMRYASRGMRAHPSLTAAIVLTIALGIGGTTSIFSVVNAVLLRPLPYTNPDRLVVLRERVGEADQLGNVGVGPFVDWSAQARSFEATALSQGRTFNLNDGEPARYTGAAVTTSYFQVLHMPPALGRYFLPDETDAERVAVLSHGLWQSRFDSDSTVVGRVIQLNGEAHTVIGVMPSAHSLTAADDQLWTILTFTPQQRANYGSHISRAWGRLRPGVTIAQAQAELDRIAAGIRAGHPEQMQDRSVAVLTLRDWRVGDYGAQLWVLLGAVAVVLLIACVNVASLLLARATSRRREIAIRSALGGGRHRLVRQLLTESLTMALAGGALGILIARIGVGFLAKAGPAEIPRLGEAGLQLDVLAFAAFTTVACGVLFGLAPALRATRTDLQGMLREGGHGSLGGVRDRLRAVLIVGEIAVTVVLLVGASLFLRSARRLQQVDIGFEPSDVTMMRVALPADRYDSATTIHRAFSSLVAAMRAIPGVEQAAAGTRVPMLGASFEFSLRVQSRPEAGERFVGNLRMVTPDYVETLGIPVRSGRAFTEADIAVGAPPVVIVNQAFAKHAFGDANPIGQRVSGWAPANEVQWREVVGVIGDVRASGQDQGVPPEVYAPHAQSRQSWWNSHQRTMTMVVKSRLPVASAMREALTRFDPLLPAFDVQPLDHVVSASVAARRFQTVLLAMLGATGLILAAIGIYGVIAFFVSQRAHEIGVRVALGATAADIVGIVLREALTLSLAGIAIGSVAALWATRAVAGMLYEVEPNDPLAFLAGGTLLLLVGIGASLIPARRAAHVDPVRALSSA